jgi:anti-sigma factor RsiW
MGVVVDPDELRCRELVELISDYLEGALPADQRTLFEEHLVICEGCVNYLGQIERTVEVVGTLRPEDIEDEARDALLGAFRGWRAQRE